MTPTTGWSKGILDYGLAALLLPLALPLIGLAALAVKITSHGPVFYTQVRLGLNGRRYRIFKIRTMHANCEARSGVRWASKGDPRVTRVGRLLRATHLDELPQLLNVLRGEMSLVGPRPERPEIVAGLGLESIPGYGSRLRVKPGVTGLAQVLLPADSDLRSVRRKVTYDLHYIRNRGIWLEFRLLFATVLKSAGVDRRTIRGVCGLPDPRVVARSFRSTVLRVVTAYPSPIPLPSLDGRCYEPAQLDSDRARVGSGAPSNPGGVTAAARND